MIDPDNVDYQSPDFGFDNYLIFEDKSATGFDKSVYWKFFMDYTSKNPKFQRLGNYIQFSLECQENEKFESMKK